MTIKMQCPKCANRYPRAVFRDGLCIECWHLGRRLSRSQAKAQLNKALAAIASDPKPKLGLIETNES